MLGKRPQPQWFILIATSIILLISRLYHPEPNPKLTLCIFNNVTGLPCPGCGLTRSFCATAKGAWLAAFHFHLLGPILFFMAVVLWGSALLAVLGKNRPFQTLSFLPTNKIFFTLFVTIFIGYWLIRIGYLMCT